MIYKVVLISAVWQTFSDTRTHTRYLFRILFHDGLSQDIERGFLCYTLGLCCLPTRYVLVCVCYSQPPSPSLPSPGSRESVLCVCESIHLCRVLDSTRK